MKYKNNITYKDKAGGSKCVNFKTREKMIDHLQKNSIKMSQLKDVKVNFGPVCLPMKQTTWYNPGDTKDTK